METHLVLVGHDFTEFRLLDLINTYLSGLSKDKISYNKSQRRIIVESLNMQFYFRRINTSLIQFVKGKSFKTVRVLNAYPDDKIMSAIYPRADEIKIERMKVG